MIFLAVSTFGFERLVKKMDEIAGKTSEEVVMQIGETKYAPKNAKYFDFGTREEIKELCRKARVIVIHGGVGILIDALEQRTPVIAVPRRKKYGEHIDDHQVQLVQELEMAGKISAVYDIERLEEALEKASSKTVELVKDKRLVDALKGYIAQFERK